MNFSHLPSSNFGFYVKFLTRLDLSHKILSDYVTSSSLNVVHRLICPFCNALGGCELNFEFPLTKWCLFEKRSLYKSLWGGRWRENVLKLWGSITLFQKRYSVMGLHNVFSKALLRYKKSWRYGVMDVHNAFFKNVMRYRYLLKAF